MPPVHRSWGQATQKIVAARQGWKCASCACMLPSSFELDHRVALWDGGADDAETNADALCPTCHAQKTQREAVERARRKREARTQAIQEAKAQTATCEGADDFLNNVYLKYAYERPARQLPVPVPLPVEERLRAFAWLNFSDARPRYAAYAHRGPLRRPWKRRRR